MTSTNTALREKVGSDCGLNATLKFDCGADGVIVIDGAATPNTVDNADRDTDCTIALTAAALAELLSGELDPTTAFMTGKIKVSGDMSVALKLHGVEGSG
jgi:putative sterol carrier protein